MATMKEAANDFLAQKCIAVVGVSRNPKKTPNFIYRRLRSLGYTVYAVNPHTDQVEGDTCYPDLRSLPSKPDGVMIVTKPAITALVAKECAEMGVKRVWMHRGIDTRTSSVSEEAVAICRKHQITTIPGGCPMMYCRHADLGHRIIRWLQGLTGSLPKKV